MNGVQIFWHFLAWVNSLPGLCSAVTQSTHSTPLTEQALEYVGNCAQAFVIALYSHGSIAWVMGT